MRPEKIVNPYGSTAGANSGDFHLYRQTRAREMERMKQLTDEEKDRMKEMEFQNKIQRDREEVEKKTDKKRKKRQKQKETKLRRKMLAKAGVNLDGRVEEGDDEDFDDFAVPAPEEVNNVETTEADKDVNTERAQAESTKEEDDSASKEDIPAPPFPNDGSFLEFMRKQLEAKGRE